MIFSIKNWTLSLVLNSFLILVSFCSLKKSFLSIGVIPSLVINTSMFIASSKKLDNSEIEKIKEEMTKDFNSKINLSYKVDESLLAGVKIKIGSK